MDPQLVTFIVIAVAVVLISPVLLFFPLVKSVSDRIAGKKGSSEELRNLKSRMAAMELELGHLRSQILQIGETQEFSVKMLETMKEQSEMSDKSDKSEKSEKKTSTS